jgi:hypothetical protein
MKFKSNLIFLLEVNPMSPIFFGNNIANLIHVNAKMNNNNFALPFINNIREHKNKCQ